MWFLHSKSLLSPLSSDDALEIELSDWLVNQDYVICKQTRDSIVTKSAPVRTECILEQSILVTRKSPEVGEPSFSEKLAFSGEKLGFSEKLCFSAC